MDIYLVRVREHPDGSLSIERKPKATINDDYIAISHVWGTPETIRPTHIGGVGTVQLSPGKKDILDILKRDDVCGEGWFWMDLFCIDQTEGASISITEQLTAIPAIYKSSRCVKILIESPICTTWQEQASRVVSVGDVDVDVFGEEELRHSRKCPYLLFRDPWFERLWTRQEGLYGLVLDVIILNPVGCRRLQIATKTGGWIAEGAALGKRTVAEFFLDDKLAYHGVPEELAERMRFQLYLDFVYHHHVDIEKYGGSPGPAPNYSPISEAWRSGRVTTKARDYVLAVFPDIEGYQVPPNARKIPFNELLVNALGQTAIQQRFHIAPKVPKGMLKETSSRDSVTPWINPEPSNIGEALDCFTGRTAEGPKTDFDKKYFTVAQTIQLSVLDLGRANLSNIKELWSTAADTIKHSVLVSPSGPCTGTQRNIQSQHGLLHQYFLHQFAPSAVVQFLSKDEFDKLEFRTDGVVQLRETGNIPEDTFQGELARFLVCLVCGTSLHTANIVLETGSLVVVETPHGKLLAVVRRDLLSAEQDFVLVGTALWHLQGLLIGVRKAGVVYMIGRTAIPTSGFWDAVQEVITGAGNVQENEDDQVDTVGRGCWKWLRNDVCRCM